MSSIQPLRDRVLLRRIEAPDNVNGIYIPDAAKEKPQHAEVVAVGDGRVLDSGEVVPLVVSVGDTVLIGKWSGTEVDDLTIVREDEILGIVRLST